ncbi:MAG TPA: sulfotransferase [Thermoanaerobaculia bacterium]|nr:sulfotransferase [Thermoanaerobaculia bacterium]
MTILKDDFSENIGPSRPVIILGVDRSGTSVVAQLTHEWGAYGGDPSSLMRSDSANPHGFWEYLPMVRLIHQVFREVGYDFWRPGYEEALRTTAGDPRFRAPAEELIASMAAGGAAWFWKEPWLCLQLPFWQEIWGDASYIITVRNPYDSSVSWQKMTLPSGAESRLRLVALGLLRWQYFMLSVLRHVEGSRRLLFVQYEDLIQDPRAQSARICGFLDREVGTARVAEGRAERMAEAVDGSLWRNRSPVDFSQIEIASREQKALYELLRSKVADPEARFDPDSYPMYPGWREYLHNFNEAEGAVRQFLGSRLVRLALALDGWRASFRLRRS